MVLLLACCGTASSFALAPCAWTHASPGRPLRARAAAPPQLMAKRKKKKGASGGKAKNGDGPAASAAVPDQPLMAVPPPAEPLMAVPPPPMQGQAPPAAASASIPFVPPPPLPADGAAPLGGVPPGFVPPPPGPRDRLDDLPPIEPLAIADEPKLRLPSFGDYKRGPAKPPPPVAPRSKLPSINQGYSYADELLKKEEKPFMERMVFGLAWGGIFFLIAVEIFINSPAFPVVKPWILNFLGDGTGYND